MFVLLDMDAQKARKSLWDDHETRWPELCAGASLPLVVALAGRIRNQWDSRIFTPVDPADYTIKASVGGGFIVPVAGTWPIIYGADTSEDEISSDPTAEEIEDALNSLDSIIAAGGVEVVGEDGFFTITFNALGVRTLLSGEASNLIPVSILDFQEATVGDAETCEVQTLRITQNVGALETLDTASADPEDQTTVAVVTTGDATHNHKVRVTLPAERYGGEWTYTSASVESDTIGWDDNAVAVQAILELVSTIGVGNVTVTQDTEDSFLVTYKGVKALQAITGIAVDGAALKVVATKSGTLDLRAPAIDLLLNGANSRIVNLEIEYTPAGGVPIKFQQDVTLKRPVTTAASVFPTAVAGPAPIVLAVTSWTGNSLTSLPLVTTTNLLAGTGPYFIRLDGQFVPIYLDSGPADPADPEGESEPADYNALTNNVHWSRGG